MAKKNTGKDFEIFVRAIYEALAQNNPGTIITQNDMVPGPDGDRECDIVIVHEMAHIPFRTVIECRDFSRRLNITAIDAFSSKLKDVKANKGILVTRNGYSKNAMQKANRLGIDLCVADRASTIKQEIVMAIPIVARKIAAIRIAIGAMAGSKELDNNIVITNELKISGVPAMEILFKSFELGIVKATKDNSLYSDWAQSVDLIIVLKEYFGDNEITIPRPDGSNYVFDNCHLMFKIQEDVFFGHTNNLTTAAHLVDLTNNKQHIVLSATEFIELENSLSRFDNVARVPSYAQSNHIFIVVVDMTIPFEKISTFTKTPTHPSSTPI